MTIIYHTKKIAEIYTLVIWTMLSEMTISITANARVLGEVALCVGFSGGKPFCQTPVIASAFS